MQNLDQTIQQIIISASTSMAREISAAVREALSSAIMGGGAGRGAIERTGAAATPAPTAKRGPGRPRKADTAQASPAKRGSRARRGVRIFTDVDIDRVLSAVKSHSGQLPSQIQAASGVSANAFEAAVRWLKKEGKLKVVGKGRKTTYQA